MEGLLTGLIDWMELELQESPTVKSVLRSLAV